MSQEYGPDAFAEEFDVSRETLERILAFDNALLEWQDRMNLIAPSTIATRWERHYRDSAQLAKLVPETAKTLVDVGSGAGFPGLLLAALRASTLKKATLVESVGKKARFLEAAKDAMGLTDVDVRATRSESLQISDVDVITARAVAALPKLLGLVSPLIGPDTICLFPKGQHVVDELTEATKSWHMDVEQIPSMTASESVILVIRNLRRRS